MVSGDFGIARDPSCRAASSSSRSRSELPGLLTLAFAGAREVKRGDRDALAGDLEAVTCGLEADTRLSFQDDSRGVYASPRAG